MGDQMEQPGPSEAKAKVIEPLEGDDVESHRFVRSLTEDQLGPTGVKHKASLTESDEDDVEGHIFAK